MSNSNKKTCATIICNGRPVLSRRAKCLVKLLKSLVPDDVLAYVECELCAETRYHQNQLVDEIFAILIDSCKIRINDDSRLAMKENELARMLISGLLVILSGEIFGNANKYLPLQHLLLI